MANDKAVSEPVCVTYRRGKSASPSQSIILLRTHWQKVTEFMVPSRINVRVMHGTQLTFTVASSALRCKANLYSFYELSRANAICFKQETGTLHDKINVHFPNQRAIQAVWLYIYCKCTTVY